MKVIGRMRVKEVGPSPFPLPSLLPPSTSSSISSSLIRSLFFPPPSSVSASALAPPDPFFSCFLAPLFSSNGSINAEEARGRESDPSPPAPFPSLSPLSSPPVLLLAPPCPFYSSISFHTLLPIPLRSPVSVRSRLPLLAFIPILPLPPSSIARDERNISHSVIDVWVTEPLHDERRKVTTTAEGNDGGRGRGQYTLKI